MIEIKQLSKIFKDKNQEVAAIDDVSLKINKGDIFGIIGYSGAGKSTLIRTLNGLEKPTAGEVRINAEDISQLKGKELRERRQKIGMIFQHFNLLWSRTVKENILFPLEIAGVAKEEQEERADELIRLVGLEGRADAYPAQLSGGQKQRVGIARALANDPEVLLCDEATSSLDPQTTDEVLDLLLDINQRLNLTIVVITHEMNVIRKICNRVAVMENGKIIESGEVEEIFKHPKADATKKLIRTSADPDIEDTDEVIENLKVQFPSGKLLHLRFHGGSAQTPIISTISRQYDVDINVIQGNIQPTKESLVGSLYIQLLGDDVSTKQAIQAFNQLGVETEEVKDDTVV